MLCLLVACQRQDSDRVAPLSQSGELVVVVPNGATSFYIDAQDNYAGLEYDLLTRFVQKYHLRVKFIITPNLEQLIDALLRGRAHLAAGLTLRDSTKLSFGPSYQTIQPVLIYHIDKRKPNHLNDIPVGSSIVVNRLQSLALKAVMRAYPRLRWHIVDEQDSEMFVEQVAEGLSDYAVVSSHGAEAAQNFYPNVGIAFSFNTHQKLAWAWLKRDNAVFSDKVSVFFAKIRKDGTLAQLLDRYYGHVRRLGMVGSVTFLARRLSTLPKYRRFFVSAEQSYGIDWRLLAALSYQESHWDPLATSPYGVRGLMMLTNDTADYLGVNNRLDPQQSIMGGSRYFAQLKQRLPPSILEPDRTWLALAAYNLGLAHILDVRVLAQRLNKDPDTWASLKGLLPLLRQPRYFSRLKSGYARGGEAVIYVEHIRNYYDILVRFEKPVKRMFPLFNEQVIVANPENVILGVDALAKQRARERQ